MREGTRFEALFSKMFDILTGAQGGWPLSMFLDENAVPFTGVELTFLKSKWET